MAICKVMLSGFQLPSSIVSTGSILTLCFTTDFAVSAQGFKAIYEGAHEKTELYAAKCEKLCLFLKRCSQLNVPWMCSSLGTTERNLAKCPPELYQTAVGTNREAVKLGPVSFINVAQRSECKSWSGYVGEENCTSLHSDCSWLLPTTSSKLQNLQSQIVQSDMEGQRTAINSIFVLISEWKLANPLTGHHLLQKMQDMMLEGNGSLTNLNTFSGRAASGPPVVQLLGPLRASVCGRKKAREGASVRTAKRSEEALRRMTANERKMCHGQRGSTSSTKDTSAQGSSGARLTDTYKRYHWYRSSVGNRLDPQTYSDRGPGPNHWSSGGVEQRQECKAESRGELRPEYSVGLIHVRKTDGSVESMPGNEQDSGMGPKRGTGRPHGLARWPENIPDGRHPVWAVPGKDWLVLLPNTVEPMEVGPQEEAEEPMEVDPPWPRQTWDYPGRSLLCAIREWGPASSLLVITQAPSQELAWSHQAPGNKELLPILRGCVSAFFPSTSPCERGGDPEQSLQEEQKRTQLPLGCFVGVTGGVPTCF
ncbi:CUB and sushi domain-containing protein 1 [Anas platyrhynchos]|uniref:CUB and sushi domain-containing protein 1 n=1 Tax=Anas platyrhynchos TaxID=8839 RepID=R0LSV2_ANAPL|nr:CUB and sushi domain-containing protein 1 [Anas platyrhynchos]